MIDTAIVLAAGLGTRLAPLSRVRAKAALPVAGEMLLRRQLRWLAAAGVRRAVVNLHHLADTITREVGHGDDLGVEVRYSWETTVLGSGGGPRRALDLVDADRVLIVNGDVLTDLDLRAIQRAHVESGALATLATERGPRLGYNSLVADADGRFVGVSRRDEAPRPEHASLPHLHFIGIQVAERRAFADASPHTPSETLRTVFPALLARDSGSVRVWPSDASYHDIGTPEEYLRTVATFARDEGRPLDRGPGTVVSASAVLDRVVCWNDVAVEANAVLSECVLADGVRVPAGFTATRASVVGRTNEPLRPGERVVGELVVAPFPSPHLSARE